MVAKLLLSLVFGVSTSFAAVKRNDVNTRYFVGPFNGGEFPIAVEQCLPFTVLGQNYQRVECISSTEAIWTYYDDENCETALTSQVVNSSTQTGMGNYFDFNCNPDYDDEYAEVEFSVGACETDTKVIMSATINVCVAATSLYILDPEEGDLSDIDSLRVYCDDQIAELQYFESPNTLTGICIDSGANANFYQVRNATKTCDYMLTTQGTNVFGRLITCTEGDDDSASKLSMFGLIIAGIFAVLSM